MTCIFSFTLWKVEGYFIQVGLVANTQWLKDRQMELSKFGEILVDNQGKTSLDSVYAAGDATKHSLQTNAGSGATAALGAFNYLMRN